MSQSHQHQKEMAHTEAQKWQLCYGYGEHEGFTFVIKKTDLEAPRKNGRTSEMAKYKLFARHRANEWDTWGNEVPVERAA